MAGGELAYTTRAKPRGQSDNLQSIVSARRRPSHANCCRWLVAGLPVGTKVRRGLGVVQSGAGPPWSRPKVITSSAATGRPVAEFECDT